MKYLVVCPTHNHMDQFIKHLLDLCKMHNIRARYSLIARYIDFPDRTSLKFITENNIETYSKGFIGEIISCEDLESKIIERFKKE